MRRTVLMSVIFLSITGILLTGCSTTKKSSKVRSLEGNVDSLQRKVAALNRENQAYESEIDSLNAELNALEADKQAVATRADMLGQQLAELEDQPNEELEQARKEFEARFKKELAEYKAKLEMTERGLMVTFLAEIFFDSGKAEIKEDAKPTLQKVASVIKDKVPLFTVVIEGHTDNDPIKYSGWKSNWELGSARALAVLHYFIDECGISPTQLSAQTYGEYKPVADNATKEGKEKNRRVEILIVPPEAAKTKKAL